MPYFVEIYNLKGIQEGKTLRFEDAPSVYMMGRTLVLKADRSDKFLPNGYSLVVSLPKPSLDLDLKPLRFFDTVGIRISKGNIPFVAYRLIDRIESPYRGFHLHNVRWYGVHGDEIQDIKVYLHDSFQVDISNKVAA